MVEILRLWWGWDWNSDNDVREEDWEWFPV